GRTGFLDVDERRRIIERERLELKRVDEAEDRGRRRDAQRQREHGGGHQAGSPPQRAARIGHVFEKADHGAQDARPAPPLTARQAAASAFIRSSSPLPCRRAYERRSALSRSIPHACSRVRIDSGGCCATKSSSPVAPGRLTTA